MVEIFTGSGLGLERSSATVLGNAGTLGSASTGTSGVGLSVNATTGNLVVQAAGETLTGVGDSVELDADIAETYNSLGLANNTNGTNWAAQGAQILNMTGTVNTAGSTVQRLGWDGSVVTYTYNANYVGYNGVTGAYVSKEASGAYDYITNYQGHWYWQNGSNNVIESYANANNLVSSRTDQNGNTESFSYTGNLLTRVTTADGEYISLSYTGNNLTQLTTHLSGGTTLTRTDYGYDTQNRLTSVKVDLTPADNSITDGNVYTTTFAYSGTSNLISSVMQTDGSEVDFTYDASNRVSSIVQRANSTTTRTTTMTYGSGATTVTDPQGNQTVLTYDAKGELLSMASPAVVGGVAQYSAYTYDANGNVLTESVYASVGNAPSGSALSQLTHTYDTNGNLLKSVDLAGDTTTYTYNTFNSVLTKTVYTTPAAGSTAASGAETTYYVYDTHDQLNYTVSQAGDVTYNAVNNLGQTTSTLNYTTAPYNTSGLTPSAPPTLASMTNWRAGLTQAQNQAAERTDYAYDFRGNLASQISYSATDVFGNGLLTSPYTKATYVYDQAGELLQKLVNTGGTTVISNSITQWGPGSNMTSQAVSPINGQAATQFTVATTTNAAATSPGLTAQAGDTVTSTISVEGVGTVSSASFGSYGSVTGWNPGVLGSAIIVSGPGTIAPSAYGTGLWTVTGLSSTQLTTIEIVRTFTQAETAFLAVFPNLDHQTVGDSIIATAPTITQDHNAVTTSTYDGLGRVLSTTDPLGKATTTAYNNSANTQTVTYANGLIETQTYDAAGELLSSVDTGTSIATTSSSYIYDSMGNLRVSTDPAGVNTYYFYDNDGRKTGQVDGDGYLTEYKYDATNRLTATVAYANALNAAQLTSLAPTSGVASAVSLTAIQPFASSSDDWNWTVYNAAGQVSQTINAVGSVTGYAYDGTGALTQTTQYATQLTSAQLATLIENTPGQNILSNPGLNGTSGWFLFENGGMNAQPIFTNTFNTVNFIRTTFTATAASQTVAIQSNNSGFAVAAGQIVNVQMGIEAAGPIANAQLAVWWYNSSGAVISGSGVSSSTGSQSYNTQVSGSAIAPTGAVSGSIALYGNTSGAGNGWLTLEEPKVTIANATLAPVTVTPNSALDRTTRDFYNADGLLIGALDARGYVSQIDYDDAGQKIDTVAYATQASSSLWATGTFAQLQASVGTSPHDQHSYLIYDSRGFVAAMIDPVGDLTRYTYTASGQVATQVTGQQVTPGTAYTLATLPAASGSLETTAYAYDGDGRVLTQTLGQGTAQAAQTSYIYDAVGNVLVSTDPNGVSTHYFYDSESRLTGEVNGDGYLTEYKYDLDSRQVATVTYANVVSQTLSNGVASPFSLTAIQPLSSNNDHWNWKVYDAASRVIQTIDSDGAVTGYSYNAVGDLTQTIHYATQLTSSQLATLISNTPGNNLLYNAGLNGISGWYSYDPNGILVAGSPFTGVWENINLVKSSFNATASGQWSNIFGNTFSINPGAKINVQTGVEAYGPVSYIALGIVWVNSSGNQISISQIGPNFTNQTGYNTQISGSATAPSGTVGAFIQLYMATSGSGSGAFDLDEPKVTTANATLAPLAVTSSSSDATTRFTYDAAGRLVSTTDADGITESYGLDAFGDRTQLTNKLGGITAYAYDADGNLLSETMSWTLANGTTNGTASTLAAGGAEASVAPYTAITNAVVNTYTYDAFGNRTTQIEAANFSEARTTNYTYDGLNRLTSKALLISAAGVTPAVFATTYYTYDGNGNVIKTIDPNSNPTYSYFDALNRMTAQVNALGVLTTYSYDNDSNLSTETVYAAPLTLVAGVTPTPTPPLGGSRETVYSYDGANRLLTTTVINLTTGWWNGSSYSTYTGNVVTGQNVYDAAGNVIESIDGNGNKTYNYYDANNNKTAQVDADGCLTTYSYDQNGNVTQEYAYANAVNTQSGSSVTLSTATTVAALVASAGTNSQDRITQFQYNAMGWRTQESRLNVAAWTQGPGDSITAASATTSTIVYAYDALGEVVLKEEMTGDATAYNYDSQGRLIATSTADTVNASGQAMVTAATDLIYEYYDGLNDVTRSVSYGANSAARTTTYTYGPGGRLASMVGAGVNSAETQEITNYYYDLAGNMTNQNDYLSGYSTTLDDNFSTYYTYDALNRVVGTQVIYMSNSGWVAGDNDGMIYNAFGEVAATTVNGTRTTQFVYDNAGHLIASNSGDGTWKSYVYDGGGNATLVIQSAGTQDLSSFLSTQQSGTVDTSTYNQAGALAIATNNGANSASTATNTTITTTASSTTIGYTGSTPTVGQAINGAGIPAGATIASVNTSAHTAVLSAAATASGTFTIGVVVTINVYDPRNQMWQSLQPQRAIDATNTFYTITTYEAYNAFGDVTSQTDARGNTTTYTYNTLDKLTAQISPQVTIASDSGNFTTGVGNTTTASPTTYNYYDVSGRLIGTRDADGNLTTQVLLAGTGYDGSKALATAVYRSDLTSTSATYDGYGDVLTQTDGMGYVTTDIYDNSGNLIQVIQPASTTNTDGTTGARTSVVTTNGSTAVSFSGGDLWVGEAISGTGIPAGTTIASVNAAAGTATLSAAATTSGTVLVATQLADYYAYDASSQQISQWNSQQGTGVTESTAYDAQGRVISTSDYMGHKVNYSYQWSGGLATTGLGTYGGWTKTTTDVDAGETSSSGTDAFGHQITKTDMGGQIYSFIYNKAGELVGQSTSNPLNTVQALAAGASLTSGQSVYSQNKQFQLIYQTDGNLVVYGPGGTVLWSSGTQGNSGGHAIMQADGNLVVYNSSGSPKWASGTVGNSGATLSLTNNGQLEIISTTKSLLWATSAYSTPVGGTGGENLAYVYYNTGKIASIADNSNALTAYYSTILNSTFTYDQNGNRLNTSYVSTNVSYSLYGGNHGATTTVLENATATYDALNRITRITDPGTSTRPSYTQTQSYDANGNIIENKTVHQNIGTGQTLTAATTDDYWYAYDAMNRLLVSEGDLSSDGTHVVPDTAGSMGTANILARTGQTAGTVFTYNADGEEVTSTTYTTQGVYHNLRYSKYNTVQNAYIGSYAQEIEQVYAYSEQGNLVATSVGENSATATGSGTNYTVTVNAFSPPIVQSTDTRDALGRILTQTEYSNGAVTSFYLAAGTPIYSHTYTYNNDSQIIYDSVSVVQNNASGTLTNTVTNTNYNYGTAVAVGGSASSTSYADGNVISQSQTSITYQGATGTSNPLTTTIGTTNVYLWLDSAQLASITATYGGAQSGTTASTFNYDRNGHVSEVQTTGTNAHTNTYTESAAGLVMENDEFSSSAGSSAPETFYFYLDDQLVGQIGNNGTTNVNYATSINNQTYVSGGTGAFAGGATTGTSSANFDENYYAINASGNGVAPTAGSYTVQSGDTLQSIAASVYGDANLWYVIANANGLSASSDLSAGTILSIPSTVENAGNTASTFKPYNANAALGDVSPGAPVPPAQSASGGCGVVGIILMIAVAVAVTALTAGAAAAAEGVADAAATAGADAGLSVADGIGAFFDGSLAVDGGGLGLLDIAAGAAVGSVASQAVGIAIGQQSSINWGSVGLSALSAGISAGVATLPGLSGGSGIVGIEQAAARGVISGALTQGIGVATGLQSSFDWAGVAASGVGAAVGAGMGGSNLGLGKFGNSLVSGAAGAIASAATRSVLAGTDFGNNVLATLPQSIGNTIGNAVAGSISQQVNTAAQIAPPQPGAQQGSGTTGLTYGALPDDTTVVAGEDSSPADIVVTANIGKTYPASILGNIGDSIYNAYNASRKYMGSTYHSDAKVNSAISAISSSPYSKTIIGGEIIKQIQSTMSSGNIVFQDGVAASQNAWAFTQFDSSGVATIVVDSSLENDPTALATILVHEGTHDYVGTQAILNNQNHEDSKLEELTAFTNEMNFYATISPVGNSVADNQLNNIYSLFKSDNSQFSIAVSGQKGYNSLPFTSLNPYVLQMNNQLGASVLKNLLPGSKK